MPVRKFQPARRDYKGLTDPKSYLQSKVLNLIEGGEQLERVGERQIIGCSEWIERHGIDPDTVNRDSLPWDYSQAQSIRLASAQKVILDHIFRFDKEGLLPYRQVVFSAIKKSGKTTLSALVAAWFADQIEPPNLIVCAAGSEEQAAGRIFQAMGPTIYRRTGEWPNERGSTPSLRLSNGTTIKAIPSKYGTQAGMNYGLVLFSELWQYRLEGERRFFEELPPVLTRKNSIRWIETYAGFEDESLLLLDLFHLIFKSTREIDAEGRYDLQPEARIVEELKDEDGNQLPCFERTDLGLFCYWDHERRMPWQKGAAADAYYAAMEKTERPSVYLRHSQNRWQPSEGEFIAPAWIDRSLRYVEADLSAPMIVACDASKGRQDAKAKADDTALVGVRRIWTPKDVKRGILQDHYRYKVCYAKIWSIPKGEVIDLEETLSPALIWLLERGLIAGPIYYDDFQLHQVMLNLTKKQICNAKTGEYFKPQVEIFNQGEQRTAADTFLFQCYRDDLIDNYPHPELIEHIRRAKAKEQEGGRCRIIKGTLSEQNQVDGAVAQSMAIYQASLRKVVRKRVWSAH